MIPTTSSTETALVPQNKLNKAMLIDALNDLILKRHNGDVHKGCAAWYKQVTLFQNAAFKGKALDQQMYHWAQMELQKTGKEARVLH